MFPLEHPTCQTFTGVRLARFAGFRISYEGGTGGVTEYIAHRVADRAFPDRPLVGPVDDAQFGRLATFAKQGIQPGRLRFDEEVVVIAGVDVHRHSDLL